ncbi:MAG: NAD(P)-dependent oxidoreductase [Collinsella sp.]
MGTLEDLCRGCDYLTLHVPAKADTVGMISTEQLALLAPGAVLVNFAREIHHRRGRGRRAALARRQAFLVRLRLRHAQDRAHAAARSSPRTPARAPRRREAELRGHGHLRSLQGLPRERQHRPTR